MQITLHQKSERNYNRMPYCQGGQVERIKSYARDIKFHTLEMNKEIPFKVLTPCERDNFEIKIHMTQADGNIVKTNIRYLTDSRAMSLVMRTTELGVLLKEAVEEKNEGIFGKYGFFNAMEDNHLITMLVLLLWVFFKNTSQ